MHLARINPLIIFVIVLAVAIFLGQSLASNAYQTLGLLVTAIVLILFGLFAKIEHLIYLTFYVLLAGSSYDYQLRQQIFYIRFLIMSLYVFRMVPAMIAASATTDAVKRPGFRLTSFHVIMLVYLLLAFGSSFYSINSVITFQRALAISILFGAVFLYLYWMSDTWQEMGKYLTVMVKATIFLLMIGFVLYVFGPKESLERGGRLRLFFFGPNELGYLCAILFPAAFWYYSEAKKVAHKVFAGIGIVLFITAMILTASRGSLVCFTLSGLLLVVLAYRKKLLLYLTAIILFSSIVYIFFPPGTSRMVDSFEDKIIRSETLSSGSGRVPIWRHAWKLAKGKPGFGYGFGSVNTLFERGYFLSAITDFQGATLHNSYLEAILELGFVGVAVLLLGLAIVFVRAVWLLQTTWGTTQQRFVATVFCCFFSGVTSAFFESWMTSPGSIFSFPFWFCAALILRMTILVRSPQETTTTT